MAALLAGILLQAGCSTAGKRTETPEVPVPAPSPAAVPVASPAVRPLPPTTPAHGAVPRSALQPTAPAESSHSRETPASTLRKFLPKTYVVVGVTATTLLVKTGASGESPSLFEEAIALSKLRGLLGVRAGIPKDTAQKTKLQNGTATIPFGASVAPSDAAAAVVAAFSVDGIQRVLAVMD